MSFLLQLLWKTQYRGSGPSISLNYPKVKTRIVSAAVLIFEPFFNKSSGVRFNLPNPSFIQRNISVFFTAWSWMIWLWEIKIYNLLLAKNFCILIKHCFKRVMVVSGKKKAIKDIRFKCYQMWAKHWREVLKYLWLHLHVFSGSVSYDVTASAHKSLLQWLLELRASFFFISSLKCTHTLTKICIYICTHAHRETNTEWLSSAFYLLNQFSKLQHCSRFLFKMPKATVPTLLILLLGCGAIDKARPSTLAPLGSSSLGDTLLNAYLKVRRSALPLIARQLGLQRWACTLVLGNPRRPFFLVVTWS